MDCFLYQFLKNGLYCWVTNKKMLGSSVFILNFCQMKLVPTCLPCLPAGRFNGTPFTKLFPKNKVNIK